MDRLLGRNYCGNFFESNPSSQEALLQLLIRSLRKPGSTLEAILAAKGIGLVFINAGDDQDEFFKMVLSLLKNTMVDALDVRLKHQVKTKIKLSCHTVCKKNIFCFSFYQL